jgi:acetyl esterase
MPLDPTVAAMLESMAAADAPALSEMTPVAAREMYRTMQAALPGPEIADVIDRSIPGPGGDIPVRIYANTPGTNRPCLIFFHGGGWVIGDLDTHDSVCRELAIEADCVVIAVDYRLAPEHPYPAAIDDCYAAFVWAHDNAAELGVDTAHIAAGGDSAGGNLTACVALRARTELGPHLDHQLLVYPVTDTSLDTASYESNGEGYMLTRDSMTWFFDQYLPEAAQRSEVLAAPLRAENLEGLPDATVITAEFDPLRDEGEAYAARLEVAGVPTTVQRFDGMIHGFFGQGATLEGAAQAMTLAATQLKKSFARG